MMTNYKVYSPDGEFIAACKYPEDAAAVVALQNSGTVRWRHRKIIWREGKEECFASESYDGAAQIMRSRRPR